jgi:phosphoglycolate phosphatase
MKERIRRFLSKFSFRTGVIFLCTCVVCYALSFGQMALPTSVAFKATMWTILFGMAKTTQYIGLGIVGVDGWRRIKMYFRRRRLQK